MKFRTLLWALALGGALLAVALITPAFAQPPAAGQAEIDTLAPPLPPGSGFGHGRAGGPGWGADQWQCPHCGRECRWADRSERPGRAAIGQRGRAGRAGRERFGRERAGRAGERGGVIAAERMLRHAEDLKLTDAQTESLERLAYDTKAQLIDLNASLQKARLEFRRQREADSDDIAAMKKQLNTLAAKRVDIQELKLKHWVDAKKVLTEEQKKLLKENFPRMPIDLD